MFRSTEIRWFKKNADSAIIEWFENGGQSFDNTPSRTDYYLPMGMAEVAVKLREGRIEIKHRVGDVTLVDVTEHAEGLQEEWVKWSFNADKSDALAKEITQADKHDWIRTEKTRMGVKVVVDKKGESKIIPIKEIVPHGVQIEYTRLELSGKTFYSFAVETFGQGDAELDYDLLHDILDISHMEAADSMGYGEFLKEKA